MQKLRRIGNFKDYIFSNRVPTTDLFDKEGILLVARGMRIPERLFDLPVYILDSSFDKKNLDYKLFSISQEIVQLYSSAKEKLQRICNAENIGVDTYNLAVEVIEDTFYKSKSELIKALWLFRSAEEFHCDHSFSVYLLYLEAFHDFKKYQYNSDFLNAKVSFDSASLKRYGLGALLHDIGKIDIGENLIYKKSSLSLGERDLVRLHPYYGVQVLKSLGIEDMDILDIVGNHHSHYMVDDSSQSILAQICNMVDIYDACRSSRSYKVGFTFEEILKFLEEEFQKSEWNPFLFNIIVEETLPRVDSYISSIEVR